MTSVPVENVRTGEFYLIEVNPRVPAWVALAVARARTCQGHRPGPNSRFYV